MKFQKGAINLIVLPQSTTSNTHTQAKKYSQRASQAST